MTQPHETGADETRTVPLAPLHPAPSAAGLAARSFGLGVATGGRATAGLAALVATSTPADGGRTAMLAKGAAKPVMALLALGELVADKLPMTSSRLIPPALAMRVAFGSAAGWALARRENAPTVVPALAGGAGAGVGSFAGAGWRRWALRLPVPAVLPALAEDAAVVGLAGVATRR